MRVVDLTQPMTNGMPVMDGITGASGAPALVLALIDD